MATPRRKGVAVGAQQAPAEAAVDGLIGLAQGSDAGVRRQAASSLAELGNARAVPALAAALGDADPEVRAQIISALGELADSRATAALANALKDESAAIRARAAVGARRDR